MVCYKCRRMLRKKILAGFPMDRDSTFVWPRARSMDS